MRIVARDVLDLLETTLPHEDTPPIPDDLVPPLTRAPDLYLNYSLAEAYIFTKNEERAAELERAEALAREQASRTAICDEILTLSGPGAADQARSRPPPAEDRGRRASPPIL